MDENQYEPYEAEVETFVIDCSDVFAIRMQRKFDGIDLQRGAFTEWRLGWRIILPPQATYTTKDVDDFAFDLQMEIFKDHGVLIAYIVEQESGEEDESEG